MKFINNNTIGYFAIAIVIILLAIIDIIVYFKYKKIFFKQKFIGIFCIVNFVIIALAIQQIPNISFERLFHFKTAEEVLDYYYPDTKIQKVYTFPNNTFYICDDGPVHFTKQNGEWDFYPEALVMRRTLGEYIATIHTLEKQNTTILMIEQTKKMEKDIEIEDSLSSEFERFDIKSTNWISDDENEILYIAILKERINKEYTITIDNNLYKFFR